LPKIEHASEPDSYRDTDGDDSERHAVGDEAHDCQCQDGKRHRRWAHAWNPIGNADQSAEAHSVITCSFTGGVV
jgi:hypothetical protein